MVAEAARKYFLGQGVPRLTCAQAVAEALRDSCDLADDFVKAMAGVSGGRAPQGYCGAVYAALQIAGKIAPDKSQEIAEYFQREAGGLTCRVIRSGKRLGCADCVEQAARIVAKTPSICSR